MTIARSLDGTLKFRARRAGWGCEVLLNRRVYECEARWLDMDLVTRALPDAP